MTPDRIKSWNDRAFAVTDADYRAPQKQQPRTDEREAFFRAICGMEEWRKGYVAPAFDEPAYSWPFPVSKPEPTVEEMRHSFRQWMEGRR